MNWLRRERERDEMRYGCHRGEVDAREGRRNGFRDQGKNGDQGVWGFTQRLSKVA